MRFAGDKVKWKAALERVCSVVVSPDTEKFVGTVPEEVGSSSTGGNLAAHEGREEL